MPIVVTSAYGTVEDVLMDARAIANDAGVSGGDVLTDDAPYTMRFVQIAYRRIQQYLATFEIETYAREGWLLNIPANTTGDPESRIIVSDSGTEVNTPRGFGEGSFATPFLPDDLVAPLRLRERPANSTLFASRMFRRNDGLMEGIWQGTYLRDWQWIDDTLCFRGATQAQDVWLKYEKHLPFLSGVGAVVPIRGVDNAAAYRTAYEFAKSRGGAMADSFGQEGQIEMDLIVNRNVKERQRKRIRRQPFRGRSGRGCWAGYGGY